MISRPRFRPFDAERIDPGDRPLAGDGTTVAGLPTTGPGFGDPRFGIMVRLAGQPDESPISLSISAQAWAPLADGSLNAVSFRNDANFRFLPKLILAGYGAHIRWSLTGGFVSPRGALGSGKPTRRHGGL